MHAKRPNAEHSNYGQLKEQHITFTNANHLYYCLYQTQPNTTE